MTEIFLRITAKANKDYTVKLDDSFAEAFERDLERLLDGKKQFEVKDLLHAFMQKCHEYYEQETRINSLLGNIGSIAQSLDGKYKE